MEPLHVAPLGQGAVIRGSERRPSQIGGVGIEGLRRRGLGLAPLSMRLLFAHEASDRLFRQGLSRLDSEGSDTLGIQRVDCRVHTYRFRQA